MAKKVKESFHSLLVLNHWMLSFFHGGSFAAIQTQLRDSRLEGINPDTGQTKFFHELTNYLFDTEKMSENNLRRYDLNIVKHWTVITEKRNKIEDTVMNMKYFQYLSLLFTEIYFDWYFNRYQRLLEELNAALSDFNAKRHDDRKFQPYLPEELNKIAFWNATGSGKTLLLHVNILQYRHYHRKKIDKIILLTPNEGLSRQHLAELELSNLTGRLFTESGSLFHQIGSDVEVIDINKLGDERGDKTFAVESFEGNNLVLVDEGHRGTSGGGGGEWLKRREILCKDGFSIEYSATFGQAVSGGKTVEELKLERQKQIAKSVGERMTKSDIATIAVSLDEMVELRRHSVKESYAKCILFDYSYKFFYEDGYGKESLILNLKDDDNEAVNHKYLTACLLSFYQQQWLYHTRKEQLDAFNIAPPLWIFVGNKVQDDDSDILAILKFFARFINHPEQSIDCIDELKRNEALLLDSKGRNVFNKRFIPLLNRASNEIFNDILKTLFNSDSRQRLKLLTMKNSSGELALQVGSNPSFGVINIGAPEQFAKMCSTDKEALALFDTEPEDAFTGSLFDSINTPSSRINVLIGSRKFTEGWSSWRVSTMGLMNMGRGEGSQIIQLFGRGVRLKGQNYSLQRSKIHEQPKDCFLPLLETLNIFGIRADYMAQFKEYLQEEGITPSDEMLEIEFAPQKNLQRRGLKTLHLRDGYKNNQKHGFKQNSPVSLFEIPPEYDGKIKSPHIKLDLYPKLDALRSNDGGKTAIFDDKKTVKLDPRCFAFFNWDLLYRNILNYKEQHGFYNLRIDKIRLMQFCQSNSRWYTLLAPPEDFEIKSFADITRFETVLMELLEGYTIKFYEALQNAYESRFLEFVELTEEDVNFPNTYKFIIEDNDEGREYFKRFEKLKALVTSKSVGEINRWGARDNMVAICFDRHLYYPLMYIAHEDVPFKMRPIGLVESEMRFVNDLMEFYCSEKNAEFFRDKDLYLMRNAASKERGVGFVMAGNFYPDFMLWIVDRDRQYLSFIDPKGLRNVDLDSAKINLHAEIQKLQKEIGDPNVILNSFILSVTPIIDLLNNQFSQAELEARNILFMGDGGNSYLTKLFAKIKQ